MFLNYTLLYCTVKFVYMLFLATGSKDCTVIIWKLDTNTLKLKSEKVSKQI